MPAPPKLDVAVANIKAIVGHTSPMPEEAAAPLPHYERTASDAWNLLVYVERNLKRTTVYQRPYDRHFHRLSSMALVAMVEAFERFIKETAAVCIDHLGALVLDDRWNVFRLDADDLAAHFSERSLGKSLCESDTWLSCATIDERFRRILADPFSRDSKKKFFFLPTDAQVPGEGWRRDTLNIVWQLRHTIVHNAGVITRSDAAKLRLLVRAPVSAPVVLWPDKSDVQSVKMFLDDAAGVLTLRVAARLGESPHAAARRGSDAARPGDESAGARGPAARRGHHRRGRGAASLVRPAVVPRTASVSRQGAARRRRRGPGRRGRRCGPGAGRRRRARGGRRGGGRRRGRRGGRRGGRGRSARPGRRIRGCGWRGCASELRGSRPVTRR